MISILHVDDDHSDQQMVEQNLQRLSKDLQID